ncbi:CLUMA_CG014654, isoform A [Clunio marinus]|uniref:CLUMA_CG014654, isoform A n=1 Tax=Clunio marinus TaxID=568069 RepID=A0A1J1IQN5_9DIPT|nr:CLUMA_CG014654, isoform A [Clunio marinus]
MSIREDRRCLCNAEMFIMYNENSQVNLSTHGMHDGSIANATAKDECYNSLIADKSRFNDLI